MSGQPRRVATLIAVLLLINLPVALAVTDAVSFYRRNRADGSLIASGERRFYVLHVPSSYDASEPTPLVVSLHGAGGWGAAQRDMSRLNATAEREDFIVVYPSAVSGAGPRIWRVHRGPGLMKDVRFVAALIDTLEAHYTIDPKRIYANGLSNGGGMAFVLSCTLSDRIAAVGLVGAAETLPWEWCRDTTAVPMIAFHGTDDPLVPYAGGTSWISPRDLPNGFPGVEAWTARWARRNRCAPRATDSMITEGIRRRVYEDCANEASVVLYTVEGGGHSWPGGMHTAEWLLGPTSDHIDASSVMWEFFQEHPLSGRR